MSGYGWKGTKVRNVDGRVGTIQRESPDFMGVELTIAVEDGTTAKVQMNAAYKDSGESGWAWLSPEFSGGAAWLPLGDHSGVELERVAGQPEVA